MARYRVIGRLAYRGHARGEEFEARLDEDAEARAVARGNIEVLERIASALKPGSYELPPGWANPREEN